MRNNIFVSALVTLLSVTTAWGQSMPMGSLPGWFNSGVRGPSQIVSGSMGWWGLRGFKGSGSAGVNAAILCTAGDAVCETETIDSMGRLALGVTGATCNNTTVICTVKQLYDQVSTNDLAQATEANRPKFLTSCIGSLPCMQFTLASTQCLVSGTSFPALSQPYTISWVAQRTGSFTTQQGIVTGHFSGTKPADYFTTSANQIWMYDGTVRAITAADSTWHTEQSVYNNATTPGAILDGTATALAGSPGSGPWTNQVAFGCDSNGIANVVPMTGLMVEGGVWSVAFTAQQGADMNTNQKAYWGF